MDSRENLVKAMYKHLVVAYTPDEARDILLQKYPDAEGYVDEMIAEVDQEDERNALLEAVKQKQKPQKEKPVTKMSLAQDLYAKAEDKSRKAMIELFMSELGLSKVAASTYYYNVKA